MKRFLYASALVGLIGGSVFVQTGAAGQTSTEKAAPKQAVEKQAVAKQAAAPTGLLGDPHGAIINTYCVGCHNSRL